MIEGRTLRNAIISGANSISNHRQAVDDLNIFPVPDGDTGTNMSMTMSAALTELSKLGDKSAGETAKVAASALLRGARGNSGVILSLLFRGFSKGLEGIEQADGMDLANALTIGVEAAYKAVMKPTEGTILTVARVAAENAVAAAQFNRDPLYVWQVIVDNASAALDTTPDLLPVLKKAGVVDAGGKGLLLIFEGMLSVFRHGRIVPVEEAEKETKKVDIFANFDEFDAVINFTYCTEFILDKNKEVDKDPAELRSYLETIGDCVVVVDDDDIIKVHVHTDNPGNALQKALEFGPLATVKIENMRNQNKEAAKEAAAEFAYAEPTEEFGFVAVSVGEGLDSLFRDLGCAQIVSGGQTMNPSTEDIVKAVEATPAKTVFVFPNNKNIIMAAEQAIPLADRRIIVIPTRTIPQGMTALLNFDPDASIEDNTQIMTDVLASVSTGQITFAARNSEFGGHQIKEGEILALDNGKLSFTSSDIHKAATKLAKSMFKKGHAFVTLIYGEGVSEEEAEGVATILQSKFGDEVGVTVINGGQPVYYYLISIE